MIVIPNALYRIPRDGDYDATGGMTIRSVIHPALPFVPGRVQDLEEPSPGIFGEYHTIESDFSVPPQAVLDCLLAKEISIDVALEYNGVSISHSGILTSTITDFAGRSRDNSTMSWSDSASSGFTLLTASIDVGRINRFLFGYGASNGVWALPIRLEVHAASGAGMSELRGTWHTGHTSAEAFGPASGISVSVFGESVTLYENTAVWSGSLAEPSGSITIQLLDWIPLY